MSDANVQSEILNVVIPADGWSAVSGDPEQRANLRRYSRQVSFQTSMSDRDIYKARVIFGISAFDPAQASKTRVEVLAENVLATGYTLVIQTWGDSTISSIGVTYYAFLGLEVVDKGALHDSG